MGVGIYKSSTKTSVVENSLRLLKSEYGKVLRYLPMIIIY